MRKRSQRRARRRAACALAKDDEPPDPVTASVAAISVAGSIYGGISAMKSAGSEAQQLQQQGAMQQQDMHNAAIQKAYDVSHFQASQGESYLSSGVTLQGTPVQVMEETRQRGQQEISAMETRGKAINSLYQAKATQTQNAGRAAFIGGLINAASSAGGAYTGYKQGQDYSKMTTLLNQTKGP